MGKTTTQKLNQERDKAANLALLRKRKGTTTMADAASISADKPLTEMQVKFVQAWAQGDTIPNAMARAGYNEQPSYGYRMAKMPNILALYGREKALYAEASQMTRKKVVDMLIESYDMAKLMSEPASMVSAAREIGKICGHYEPQKREININVHGRALMTQMSEMSDEQLMQFIQKGVVDAAMQAIEYEEDEEEGA